MEIAPDFGFDVNPKRVVLGVPATPLVFVFTEPGFSSNAKPPPPPPRFAAAATAANPGKTGAPGVINCPVIICGI